MVPTSGVTWEVKNR
jgi:hypothetical protein